jgi:hypothetical protein|tara:strand:+ start:383 stop:712 length:330 start_codon:yes stop_codon:yes gene_type:complete
MFRVRFSMALAVRLDACDVSKLLPLKMIAMAFEAAGLVAADNVPVSFLKFALTLFRQATHPVIIAIQASVGHDPYSANLSFDRAIALRGQDFLMLAFCGKALGRRRLGL